MRSRATGSCATSRNLNQCKKTGESGHDQARLGPHLRPTGRLGPQLSNSANCKPPAVQLTLPPADGTVYFCAANSTGVLRYVTDPSQCTSTEFLVFVTTRRLPTTTPTRCTKATRSTSPRPASSATTPTSDRLNAVSPDPSIALSANGLHLRARRQRDDLRLLHLQGQRRHGRLERRYG